MEYGTSSCWNCERKVSSDDKFVAESRQPFALTLADITDICKSFGMEHMRPRSDLTFYETHTWFRKVGDRGELTLFAKVFKTGPHQGKLMTCCLNKSASGDVEATSFAWDPRSLRADLGVYADEQPL